MSYDILGLTGNFPCDKIKKYRNKKIAPYYQYGTILLNTCPQQHLAILPDVRTGLYLTTLIIPRLVAYVKNSKGNQALRGRYSAHFFGRCG